MKLQAVMLDDEQVPVQHMSMCLLPRHVCVNRLVVQAWAAGGGHGMRGAPVDEAAAELVRACCCSAFSR